MDKSSTTILAVTQSVNKNARGFRNLFCKFPFDTTW